MDSVCALLVCPSGARSFRNLGGQACVRPLESMEGQLFLALRGRTPRGFRRFLILSPAPGRLWSRLEDSQWSFLHEVGEAEAQSGSCTSAAGLALV